MNHVETNQKFIDSVKSSSIFQPGIGIVKGFKACVELKAGARPKNCNFRKPPFAFREKICKKLDSLEEEGFLIKVDHSEYASPIHPVMKAGGDVRLCGDYKSTLNPNVDTKCYPLPTIEDCLWEIRGSTIFTKLDIKQAYNHLPLREADQLLTTINTHQGLYKWTRVPYGWSSAGGIFQAKMDEVLQGIPNVTCRVDDILIGGRNEEEHMESVRQVVAKLENAGFHCRLDKCKFCNLLWNIWVTLSPSMVSNRYTARLKRWLKYRIPRIVNHSFHS